MHPNEISFQHYLTARAERHHNERVTRRVFNRLKRHGAVSAVASSVIHGAISHFTTPPKRRLQGSSISAQRSYKKRKIHHKMEAKKTPLTATVTPVEVPRGVATNYMDYVTINHKYFDQKTNSTNATDALQWYTFKPFSMFDSGQSNNMESDHQPNQRDAFAAMYDYYRVLSCNVRITLISKEASSSSLIKAVTLKTKNLSDFLAAVGSYTAIAEMKHASSPILLPGGGFSETVLEYNFTPGEWEDDISLDQSEETWTAVASDPAVPRYFGIGIQDTGNGGGTFTSRQYYLTVEMTYQCQWRQYKQATRTTPS